MSDTFGGGMMGKPAALDGMSGGLMGPAKRGIAQPQESPEDRQRMMMAAMLMRNAGPPASRAAPVAAEGAGGWMSGLAGILGGITSGMQQQGMQAGPSLSPDGKMMAPDGSSLSLGKAFDTGFGLMPMQGGPKG